MQTSADLSIFKDYDIRGIYPSQINAEAARDIAHAIVRKFSPKSIAIGRDMRLSGEELKNAFVDEFIKLGVDVTDIGLVGTEIQYFVAGTYDFDLVIMLSASHNPPQYNGLKLVKKGPIAVTSDSGLFEIRDLIQKGKLPANKNQGQYKELNCFAGWRKKVLSLVNTKMMKPFKVVVDAGNGMAGKLVPFAFVGLPFRLVPMYMELDGSFPHHIPNPLIEENTQDIKRKMSEIQADIGLTFDGDADRVFLIDDLGRMVTGTVTTAILAKYFLKRYPGEMILYNAICGRIVPQTIAKLGGASRRVRVGHSYIKTYMRETGAIFCGEHSGHYFYRDYYGAESGVLTALLIMSLMSYEKRKLSNLVDEFDVYPASGEINFAVSDADKAIQAIRDGFYDAVAKDEVDGVSVWYKDYWFNVRLSKTEPWLRLNVEADTKTVLQNKTSELIKFIEALGGQRK